MVVVVVDEEEEEDASFLFRGMASSLHFDKSRNQFPRCPGDGL